jgi:hypothetical protein
MKLQCNNNILACHPISAGRRMKPSPNLNVEIVSSSAIRLTPHNDRNVGFEVNTQKFENQYSLLDIRNYNTVIHNGVLQPVQCWPLYVPGINQPPNR